MRKALVGVALLMVGCAPIENESVVQVPRGRTLTAGVGDVIYRAEGRENLPNAFGKSDIFGRTRPTGFEVVQYGGLRDGEVMLIRSGVTTQSNATTMNSTGIFVPSQKTATVAGTIGNTPVTGSATVEELMYIPPSGSTSVSAQNPTLPILVDWRKDNRVQVGGSVIVIENATETSIRYRVE